MSRATCLCDLLHEVLVYGIAGFLDDRRWFHRYLRANSNVRWAKDRWQRTLVSVKVIVAGAYPFHRERLTSLCRSSPFWSVTVWTMLTGLGLYLHARERMCTVWTADGPVEQWDGVARPQRWTE